MELYLSLKVWIWTERIDIFRPPVKQLRCTCFRWQSISHQRLSSTIYTQCKLHEVLGSVNFYHCFSAHTLQLLNNLLSKASSNKQALQWDNQGHIFYRHKTSNSQCFTTCASPAATHIMVDASNIAVGAVFQQEIYHQWQLIAFFSKKLSRSKYSTYDRESFAIYLSIKHFQWSQAINFHLTV